MLDIKITRTTHPKEKPQDETKLGFGKKFTDHMFVMDYTEGEGWHDARNVPYAPFSLDPAMSLYFEQIKEIKSKNVLCFVTQHFKKTWMGGSHAMKQLLALLKKKGISAKPIGVVNWSSEQREAQILQIVQKCSSEWKELKT